MNIAVALKNEIARVARKEIKAETQLLKKSSAQYRSDIAALKRRISDLERALKKVGMPKPPALGNDVSDSKPVRLTFSPASLAAQRKRLALSAQELGKLIGVSGQSIYKWEQGKTVPRASQLMAIRSIRAMGKKEVAEKLTTSET